MDPQFVPPRLPACSRFTPADASTAASTSYDPETARYWVSVASSRAMPGAVLGAVLLGGGLASVCVTAAASAARVSRLAARARRRAAREEELKKREGNSFDIVANASSLSRVPTTTSSISTSTSSTLPCLSALVVFLCAAVLSLSIWGIVAAALALKNQPKAAWQAASGAADAASLALIPGDAAVTLARQAQSGLLSLAESLPLIVSSATGGGNASSSLSSASSALLASMGLDVKALQADATSAAAAAGAVADRGGDAAAAVRSALTEGFERARRDYEARSERAAAAATAGVLALTLGFLAAASLVLGAVSLSSCCCPLRKRKSRTSPPPPRTRRFLLAAALAFVAASLGAAAGLAGGAVAAEASKDACLYGETAAARLAVASASASSSSSSASPSPGSENRDLASKLALFYLDGGDDKTTASNKTVFSLLGITPDLERLLFADDSSTSKKPRNGTLAETAALGGAALALLQTDAGRTLVANAGLPARERRSILNLPETVSSLRARAREFERAAAPSRVSPSLSSLKELPCCALRDASAPWAAASTAGGFVLAAAASLACFAGVAAAAGAGAGAGAPPPRAPAAAATEEGEQGAHEEGEEEPKQRASCWPRRQRRRDGFFRSRDAAGAADGAAAAGELEAEVEPRPWPTL